ncbi:MAG: right-handed parallel beta-helix repeat-containing protein, partial [Planctomycetaceae bacterium]|nr:right-handed parallel beta-helix repeat-containing protein [Planctomycetaceae bacterium]
MIRSNLTMISLILATTMTAAAIAEEPPTADIFLSPDGRDTWSGTLPDRNSDLTDGPLATLAAAHDAVRKLRAAEPARKTPVIVMLRQGRYELDQTLELGRQDSGTAQSPTIYCPWPQDKVRISGGRIVGGWTVDPRGWWQTRLPEVAEGRWAFMQLFVDGQRRFRPRLPGKGFYLIERTLKETPAAAGKGYDRFGFAVGDIKADWANRGDIEVIVFHSWTTSRLHIAAVEGNAVTFTGPTAIQEWWMSLQANRRYLVENVKEALGKRGQWYLDRPSGVLTYVPMDGETPQRSCVIAPRLKQLMRLDDVEHVQFEGLTFEHADWSLEPQGRSVIQAEVPYPAAIMAVGIRDCLFNRCVFQHVGEYALELGLGCKNNRIVDCEVIDTGAGAIKIGSYGDADTLHGTKAQLSDETVASHNVLSNCLLAQGGRVHPGAVGLWVGHAHHNTLENNEIYDHYYSGVNLGWSGTYGPHFGHHNDFAFNLVHKIGQNLLNDMGGVYTRGISPGTTIRNNVIRDVM